MRSTTPSDSELQHDAVEYEVIHTTHYSYESIKRSSVMSLCMKPRETERQHIESYSLSVTPETLVDEDLDIFGNSRHVFDVHRPHKNLTVSSSARVRMHQSASSDSEDEAIEWDSLDSYRSDWRLWEYLNPTDLTRTSVDLKDWSKKLGSLNWDDPVEFLESLEQRLSETISYRPGRTTIDSTVEEVLTHREGVCQDISQLMIAIARSWNIPARYVSGYLYDTPGDANRFAEDATHAWVECLLPNTGWRSFDPTNPGGLEDSRIIVGYGRDYRDVPPIKGITVGEGEAEMDVNVVVLRTGAQQYQQVSE
ncbi:MAG: transglutaminase family protein [Gammaproteobacteria bacterium]|nr:transglutaminase family protein [Gammaproteobacteria bacterium]